MKKMSSNSAEVTERRKTNHARTTVPPISYERTAYVRHVDTYLMCASRFRRELYEAVAFIFFERSVARFSLIAPRIHHHFCLISPSSIETHERSRYDSREGSGTPCDEGEIGFFDFARAELFCHVFIALTI